MYLTVRSLALNFALDMNIDRLCSVPSQYQGLNNVEFDRLGCVVIQRYSLDFTYRFAIACHGIHYPIGIILTPSAHEFVDMKARFQLRRHSSQTFASFNQRVLGSQLYVDYRVGITIQRSLLQPVEITVQMNSRYCGGVSSDSLCVVG